METEPSWAGICAQIEIFFNGTEASSIMKILMGEKISSHLVFDRFLGFPDDECPLTLSFMTRGGKLHNL
ncbi:MAG: hypothetical protein Q8N68_01300, partial [bacterium]|nr:hypothetical protein [bacterium]